MQFLYRTQPEPRSPFTYVMVYVRHDKKDDWRRLGSLTFEGEEFDDFRQTIAIGAFGSEKVIIDQR